MVSIKKKVKTSLLLLPFCFTLYSCNESEFYEKEYLDDTIIDKKVNPQEGGNTNGPTTQKPPIVDVEVPQVIPPIIIVEVPKVIPPIIVVEEPKVIPPIIVVEEPKVIVVEEPKVIPPIIVVEVPKVIVVEEPKVIPPIIVVEEPKVIVVEEPKVIPPVVIDPPIDNGPTIKLQDVKNEFTQNISKKSKVDILWVIDDSGSMRDEQKALAYNFDIFIHEFIEKKIDFQMAITTTDSTNGRRSTNYRSRRRGRHYNTPARDGRMIGNIDDLTSAAAAKNESLFYKNFAKYINVGTRGSIREKGLHTSLSFLKRYGDSYFRKDAYTIIVYVSDEEDQSSLKTKHYVKAFQDTKKNAGMIKIYSIVTQKKTRRWESVGSRYIAASELTGGTSSHIKGDFYTILRDMGGKIVDLTASFALAKKPFENKILVEVNGNEANPLTYDYDHISRSIKFKKGFLPSEGKKITVRYQVEVND